MILERNLKLNFEARMSKKFLKFLKHLKSALYIFCIYIIWSADAPAHDN